MASDDSHDTVWSDCFLFEARTHSKSGQQARTVGWMCVRQSAATEIENALTTLWVIYVQRLKLISAKLFPECPPETRHGASPRAAQWREAGESGRRGRPGSEQRHLRHLPAPILVVWHVRSAGRNLNLQCRCYRSLGTALRCFLACDRTACKSWHLP